MWDSLIEEAQHYVGEYGYWAVFLGVFLENFGLPTPGESLMIAGAVFASAGKLDIYTLLALCWLAAVMGDNIGYAIGYKGGRPLVERYGPRVGIKHSHIEHVEGFFQRHGGAVVVFARFVVVLRQLNGIVAGTMGMRWWHFVAYNALGAALWVGFWGGLAFWLGKRFKEILRAEHFAQPYVIAAIAAAIIVAVGYYFIVVRRRPKKRKRAARGS